MAVLSASIRTLETLVRNKGIKVVGSIQTQLADAGSCGKYEMSPAQLKMVLHRSRMGKRQEEDGI